MVIKILSQHINIYDSAFPLIMEKANSRLILWEYTYQEALEIYLHL